MRESQISILTLISLSRISVSNCFSKMSNEICAPLKLGELVLFFNVFVFFFSAFLCCQVGWGGG